MGGHNQQQNNQPVNLDQDKKDKIQNIVESGDAALTVEYASAIGAAIRDKASASATQTQIRALFARFREVQRIWSGRSPEEGYREAVLLHPLVRYFDEKNKLGVFGQVLLHSLVVVRGNDTKPDLKQAQKRFDHCVDFVEAIVSYAYQAQPHRS